MSATPGLLGFLQTDRPEVSNLFFHDLGKYRRGGFREPEGGVALGQYIIAMVAAVSEKVTEGSHVDPNDSM